MYVGVPLFSADISATIGCLHQCNASMESS